MSSISPAIQYNAKGVRSGKFRHIYGEASPIAKRYKGICTHLTAGESNNICVNDKYYAIPLQNKIPGAIYINSLNNYKRFDKQSKCISVQTKKILDLQFSPFISNLIGTASDDCSVALTLFPKNGILTENIKKPNAILKGHTKKVLLIDFNKTANNIIVSAGFDKSIKLWDITKQNCVKTFTNFQDNIQSMKWNYNGSLVGCTSKDKFVRIFDPRKPKECTKTASFDGIKSSKIFWLQNLNWIGATGFSKKGQRLMKFWDLKKPSALLHEVDLGQQFQILVPNYDNDLGVIYLYEKGGSTVWYGEIINDKKKYYPIKLFRDNNIQKGGNWVPKRFLNTTKCEIQKFYKITKDTVIPVTFYCPRKTGAEVFQDDIYPDCFSGKPAFKNNTEWINGENKDPLLTSMDPDKILANADDNTDNEFKVDDTPSNNNTKLINENKQLKAQILQLQNENNELKTENETLKQEIESLKANVNGNQVNGHANENGHSNENGYNNDIINDDNAVDSTNNDDYINIESPNNDE